MSTPERVERIRISFGIRMKDWERFREQIDIIQNHPSGRISDANDGVAAGTYDITIAYYQIVAQLEAIKTILESGSAAYAGIEYQDCESSIFLDLYDRIKEIDGLVIGATISSNDHILERSDGQSVGCDTLVKANA